MANTEWNTASIHGVAVPLAIGVMPLAFSALQAAMKLAQSVGAATPALANRSLLIRMPKVCPASDTAYTLPSARRVSLPSASAGRFFSSGTLVVLSGTR